MAEQTLIDYIKKARVAGQADSQSRELLLKNGWTQAETDDAFASLSQAAITPQQQPKPEPEPEPKLEPEPELEPEVQAQPQVQVRPASQQSQLQAQIQQNMPRMKNPSHKIVSILMVLIIVVILGGAGLFVAGQYLNINIPFNPFGVDPKIVIGKMQEGMKTVKAFRSSTTAELSAMNANKNVLGKITFNATGGSDTMDGSNPKMTFNPVIKITTTDPKNPIFSVSSNIVTIGSVAYVKFDGLNVSSPIPMSGIDISQIEDKTFKIDQDSIKVLAAANSTPALVGVTDLSETANADLQNKIKDLVSTADLLEFKKDLGSEKINSIDTYHYLLTMSKDNLNTLLTKIIALQTTADASMYANMAQSMVKSLTDTLGDIDVQVWIGKNDYMLYKFDIDKQITLGENLTAFGATSAASVQVKINVVYSDFNKALAVQAPADAQKIEDVLLPALKIQKIKSNLTSISGVAETILLESSNSYASLCYKGLLNGYNKNYGQTLIDLNTDIVNQGGKKPICLSAVNGFCVSSQLADGTWVCVDENHNLGTTKCVSSATDCE